MNKPVVLVTGTSSGIGRAAVIALAEAGCHVIATARKPADIMDLEHESVDVLELDVTNDATMRAAVDTIIERHGRIDALVNNAGFGVMSPMEELPMESMRHMFEVNVFGLQRLTQLVLPHMRNQAARPRFGSGRIVNVSSAAGHIAIPMMGAYCATKFSVRAMSLAMAPEVKPFGIQVSLIEPGAIKTKFGERSIQETKEMAVDHSSSSYETMHLNWDAKRLMANGGDVDIISRRIVHACTARRSKMHYLAPYDAKAARFAARMIPDPLTNRLTGWYFWRKNRRSDGNA